MESGRALVNRHVIHSLLGRYHLPCGQYFSHSQTGCLDCIGVIGIFSNYCRNFFLYVYAAYLFGLMLAALGAYLVVRHRKIGSLLAIGCLTLSMGIFIKAIFPLRFQ